MQKLSPLRNTRRTPSLALRRTNQLSKQVLPAPESITSTQTASRRSLSGPSTNMSSPEMNNQFRLENLYKVHDRVAVISGGGSGIGLMCTQALAVNGCKVYIIGRTEEKLQRVAEAFGKDIPGQIIPLPGDITNKEHIAQLVETVKSKEEHVDILINNAGISSKTLQTEAKSAEEMSQNLFHNKDSTFQDWVDTYQTNVPQCFFMTMAFLPLLEKATVHQHGYSGTAINICSISGIVKTSQHHFAYNASKAAVIHLTKMLSSEISSNGIKVRVNSIAPGVFPSEMTAGDSDENQKSYVPAEKYQQKVPAGRPGNDRDFGNAILFMATNQYLQGQTVAVDGGYIIAAGA